LDVLTQSILPFVGILVGLIVVHEAGHYITAKMFGVKVLEAGLGYPPRVWGFKRGETEYTINALPLGGFVRLLGEEDPSDPRSLAARPKWQRTVVLASGAFMNLVLAIALFSVALMLPRTVSEGAALIVSVAPGSPAQSAGLEEGDEIYAVNGRRAPSQQDAAYLMRLYQGSTIDLTLRRTDPRTGTETFEKAVYSRWNPQPYADDCGVEHATGPIGITIGTRFGQQVPFTQDEQRSLEKQATSGIKEYREQMSPGAPVDCYSPSDFAFFPLAADECAALPPEERAAAEARKQELFAGSTAACYDFDPGMNFVAFTKTRSLPPWEAIPQGARLSFESLILARNQVWSWIRGFADPQVTGPVGIAQATGEVVEEAGWKSLIDFAALLSMNLAVLNILPIPMFDGGRLMFVFIEWVRGGRRIEPRKEALVHLVGLVMILTLAVVITYFDILRIFRGDSLLR
jgi:regulator of sigma E protease